MKKLIYTLNLAVLLSFCITAMAQTTYNVPPNGFIGSGIAPLNEFMAENFDSLGLSTYVLEPDGYYVLSGSMGFSGDLAIVAGEGEGLPPVVIMGVNEEGGSLGWGFIWTDGDVLLRGLNLKVTNILGARGPWSNALFRSSSAGVTYEVDNCIIEYSDGVSIWHEDGAPAYVYITNNLFRWNGTNNGGRWQGFASLLKNGPIEMTYVENNTFVENYSCLFIHENGHAKNNFFNHNTIVSNGQGPLRHMYSDRAVLMNNLFVDAHFGGETPNAMGGQDTEQLPMGIYAIDYYRAGDEFKPEGYPAESERINLIAFNANFVSQGIKDHWNAMPDTFHVADFTKGDNGFLNDRAWKMIRSEGDFNYPYFLWDDEFSVFLEDPGFVGYQLKVAEMIEISKAMNGYDANISTENGQWGRFPLTEGTSAQPVPRDHYDFSYTNEKYKTASYAGYPIGDLNWWPEKKAEWEADPNRENYDDIIAAILAGTFKFQDDTSVRDRIREVQSFVVYPNPVSDNVLNVKGAENELKSVYSITGQTLIITRDNQIDVSGLKSGLYIIRIGDSVQKFTIK
jgi:hypothetical protein